MQLSLLLLFSLTCVEIKIHLLYFTAILSIPQAVVELFEAATLNQFLS
jgi:hypothetical protein